MSAAPLDQLSPVEKRELLRRLLAERAAGGTASFPLAHGQRALWFVQRLLPDTYAYNLAFSVKLRPPLDLDAFQRALDQLVERHSALRTVFPEQDGQPVQRVLAPSAAPLRVVDVGDATDEEVYALVCADHRRPFDLDASLFAVSVYRRPDEDVLLINVHHLVFDGRSLQVLFEELRLLYEAESRGVRAALPAPAAPYREFVASQTQVLDDARGEELWAYWSAALAGSLPVLEVASAAPRPPSLGVRGASVPFSLTPELSAALRALARGRHTTLYTVLFAAVQVLLHQFSGQSDIIVGTPVSLRTRSEFSAAIGYFINMLPLRGCVRGDDAFVDLLDRARERVLGALEHRDFPFPLMVDRLHIRREANRNPIFQAMLNVLSSPRTSDLSRLFDPTRESSAQFGASALTPYEIPQQEGQFELVVEVLDTGGVLRGSLKYQSELYSADAARQMRDAFAALLAAVAADPSARVADLISAKREDFEL